MLEGFRTVVVGVWWVEGREEGECQKVFMGKKISTAD